MISILGYVLECAAVAAFTGTAVAAVTLACIAAVQPARARLGPGTRSDLALVAALLPALAAIALTMAVAAPALGSALGFAPDHCAGHAHHFHICFVHSANVQPALATVGAFSLTVWLYRAGALVTDWLRQRWRIRSLERLATRRDRRFPVLVLPGDGLCHATGLMHPRIMLSARIAEGLSDTELAAALAHEEAHLRRRDPVATFCSAVAGLFVPPPLATWLRRFHSEAAEEACDAAAAHEIGDGAVVAGALVKVASMQRGRNVLGIAAAAFGRPGLEQRVTALLEGQSAQAARSWGLALAGVAGAAFSVLAYRETASLHHAAETLLGAIF